MSVIEWSILVAGRLVSVALSCLTLFYLFYYSRNVGATTPVGRYPEGATTHGLMDMAGKQVAVGSRGLAAGKRSEEVRKRGSEEIEADSD